MILKYTTFKTYEPTISSIRYFIKKIDVQVVDLLAFSGFKFIVIVLLRFCKNTMQMEKL